MTRRFLLRAMTVPALVFMLAGLGWSGASWGMDLKTAKEQGLVGEQPNGYLGLVKSGAPGDVTVMINKINSLRKKEYQRIAQQNKTELNVVEKLAGKKAIEKTPSGQYVKLPSGQWRKK